MEFVLSVARIPSRPTDPQAITFHALRSGALHTALEGVAEWKVVTWGKTDDAVPHEWVEVCLSTLSHIHIEAAAVSALSWLTLELIKAGISESFRPAIHKIMSRLGLAQKNKQIADVEIKLPEGCVVVCYPNSTCVIIKTKKGP